MKQTQKVIEVRKINHAANLSEETYAYTAEVWVDGRKFCKVQNQGHGGPDMQYPVEPFTYKDVADLDAWMKKNLPGVDCSYLYSDGRKATHEMSLELYCGEAVTDHLVAKDLTRMLKSKMLWVDGGKLWQVPIPKKLTAEQLAKWLGFVRQKYSKVSFLNDMSFEKALAAYKAVSD